MRRKVRVPFSLLLHFLLPSPPLPNCSLRPPKFGTGWKIWSDKLCLSSVGNLQIICMPKGDPSVLTASLLGLYKLPFSLYLLSHCPFDDFSYSSLVSSEPLLYLIHFTTHILAWRIPWTEEPVRLQSMGLQSVRHNWVTNTFTFTPFQVVFSGRVLLRTPKLHALPKDPNLTLHK